MSTPNYYLVSPVDYGALDRFTLTYSSDQSQPVGQIVKIPLGRTSGLGVVIEAVPKPEFTTKPIQAALEQPPLPEHLVKLAAWMSSYYFASAKSVWQTLLPSGLNTRAASARRIPEANYELPRATKITPSPEQAQVIKSIEQGTERSYLLHGVTGSGKTLVYLELTKKVLASGRSVVILVPEIALTPQLEAHFRLRFGPVVISSHSGLTPAGRRTAWLQALKATSPQVVIGPRSSLFLPLQKLGLIVIDECHETTYKQEQNPRYQTEAVAAKLSALSGAKLVLGSATPNLSQLFLATRQKMTLLNLHHRANLIPASKPLLIDLKDKSNQWPGRLLSRPLLEALKNTLADKRQSILYINRRGSASSLICSDCGYVSKCPNCSIALTFHADTVRLLCHYCGWQTAPPAVCPDCSKTNLRYIGGGTKRVEAEIARLLPQARLSRLDKDSSDPNRLHQIYGDLRAGKVDILIGTQMVAKGLDLPSVDTVGIVSADTLLHIPDYTASERTFQLITQVSGRTGRGQRPGQVIIQSYTPEHPSITAAANDNFESFAAAELKQRQQLGYPPFVYLLKLTCALKTDQAAAQKANQAAQLLRQLPHITVLGPTPAFYHHLGGQFRHQIIIKSLSRSHLLHAAKTLPPGWTIDLDPINLL